MPSEVDEEDMVSKHDDATDGDSRAETEFTPLDNTRQEESNNCLQNAENGDTSTRNDNYAFHNVAETRNLDNAVLTLNCETIIMENGSRSCESGNERIRIMENDVDNNPTESFTYEAETQINGSNEIDAPGAVSSLSTSDNTTQTSIRDTQPENEPSKKNFTRCLESNINNCDNSQSTSGCSSLFNSHKFSGDELTNGQSKNCDSIDGAASLPLQIPETDSSAGEGSSCDNDIVLINRNKPFKLPSLVNLYEAAEAQRAELEDRDVLTAMSSMEIDSGLFMGSESSNSDAESQQASDPRRNKKVNTALTDNIYTLL
jgi:hypothetical protein